MVTEERRLVCRIIPPSSTSSLSRKGSGTSFEFRRARLSIVSSFSDARMDERECGPDTFDSHWGLYDGIYLLTFGGVFSSSGPSCY